VAPRDTRTGSVLENMVRHALDLGGYSQTPQRVIGSRPGGGKHKVDVLASKAGRTVLVSLKWQQVSGTAEQKVPFEVICLAEAVRESNGTFDKAYLVLGGEGWTLREFFVGGGLQRHLKYGELVEIMTLESFVGRANAGRL
jgi:PD-(D/E)XK nuclease superfamily protein